MSITTIFVHLLDLLGCIFSEHIEKGGLFASSDLTSSISVVKYFCMSRSKRIH